MADTLGAVERQLDDPVVRPVLRTEGHWQLIDLLDDEPVVVDNNSAVSAGLSFLNTYEKNSGITLKYVF